MTLVWVTEAQTARLVLANVGKVAMKTTEVMGILKEKKKGFKASTVRLENMHCGKNETVISGKRKRLIILKG